METGTATGTATPSPASLRNDWVDLFAEWYDDPLSYFEVALRAHELRKWQRSLLAEIRDRRQGGELHTRVHVRTNHGSGKTYLAGGLCNWWQTTRPGARTFTTAPTWELLETRLWVEIRKHYQKSLPETRLGELMPRSARWYTGGDSNPDWFAMGGSSDHPANLEGFHSWAMARIIDEAKAVPDAVYTATDGMFFPCDESFDLWISTPSTRNGRFYERDLADDDATLIRRVVTIDDLIADGMPGAVEGKKRFIVDYGGEHTFEYRSRAMAEYIDNAEGSLFPFSWIERAMMSDEERERAGLPIFHVGGRATVGYDVAGSVSGDENAVMSAYGPDNLIRYEVHDGQHWHQHDTMISKDRVIEFARDLKPMRVRVDVQGLGKGVSDAIMREIAERHLPFFVEEYRSADPAEDPDRFINQKAENAWSVRTMLEQDRLRLPKSPMLRKQMAEMKYEVRNGKIRVIDPDDSPDHWDAVLMAIGGVYHSVSLDDIGGGGGMTDGWATQDDKHLGWTARD